MNVTFGSNFFSPKDITIQQGDTVIWTNAGGSHTVTGDSASNPNGDVFCGNTPFGTGGNCTNTFNTPGLYRYRCVFHSTSFTAGMVGTVTVLPPVALTNATKLAGDQFQFTVISTAGTTNIVEASTNLTQWLPIVTNVTVSGRFSVTEAGKFAIRFYRVRMP